MFSMNHIHIKTDRDLTEKEAAQIRGIFSESNCPNESLRATFGDAYIDVNEDGVYVFNFGGQTFAQLINIVIEQ